jgi:hypothetical protein
MVIKLYIVKGENMKIGDLVKYSVGHIPLEVVGVVTYVNDAGGTLCIQTVYGDSRWVVTSGCKVIA